MQNPKLTRSLRQSLVALCLVISVLLPLAGAKAQITAVAQGVQAAWVNNPRFQYFPFVYDTRGNSLWGPGVPGTQTLDFALPLTSPTWSENLGSFFDPCFGVFGGCTFGAGLQAGVSASTSAKFSARADLGSVDLHCPGGVGIIYPEDSAIQPGQPFTIQTYCIVEPTAYMNINATHLGLKVSGRIEGKLDLALVAIAAGNNLVDINLFKLIGLPSPSIVGEQELLDTGNLAQSIQDIPLPIPPNIGSGLFHVPNLGARGTLRNDKLKARAADNFLTANVDLTNLLLQYTAFGIPIPLNGAYDFSGFNFSFQLFDLQLQAAAGIRQDFTFDPRPLIQFKVLGGVTKTIRAGESVTFTAPPADGSLAITPTIVYDQNTFSDDTQITVDPSLSFNLIKIKGGGHVAGHDLFSFNLNPFGTQKIDDSLGLPLFDQAFALPAPPAFACPTFRIGASVVKAVTDFVSITRELTEEDGFGFISGALKDASSNSTIVLYLQGSMGTAVTSSDVSRDGTFSTEIRDVALLGQYRPITVYGEYNNANNQIVTTNPVTIYWPRPALPANPFGVVAFDPDIVPNGKLIAYSGTGKFTIPLHSLNVEPDASLLYDDIPIATEIQPSAEVPDGYLVVGEIPDFLLNRGGDHTLSFLNSGVNQTPTLVLNVVVNNAVPKITDVVKKRSLIDDSPLLFVRGSGFTLDTAIKIGGQTRPTLLISPTELRVPLLDPDCVAGVHPVAVSNPIPGGGSASASYEVAPVAADIPSLIAKHDLLRSQPANKGAMKGDTVADLITLTNAGKNVLRDVTITSVRLLIKGRAFAATGIPQKLPVLRPGDYSSAQVILPPHSSVAGDVGILQVRGTVHGKAFVLSNRVTMPAFEF